MQLEIHPSIKPRVRQLNALAKEMIESCDSPANVQFRFGNNVNHNEIAFPATNKRNRVLQIIAFNQRAEPKSAREVQLETWHETERTSDEESLPYIFELPNASIPTALRDAWDRTESEAIKQLQLKEGQHVLELGPGKGSAIAKILRTKAKVTAIDHLPAVTAKLQRQYAPYIQNGQLKLHTGQYTETTRASQWRHGEMDHVVSFWATNQHPFPQNVFKMVRAALKPGGTYTFVEATPFYDHTIAQLKKAGLQVEKVEVKETVPKIPIDGKKVELYTTVITAVKA
ncbi:MAG: methyltransferase domain-containing protein [Candidatus Micrarchaeota archaeon]